MKVKNYANHSAASMVTEADTASATPSIIVHGPLQGAGRLPIVETFQRESPAAALSKPRRRPFPDTRPDPIEDWTELRADGFHDGIDPAAIAEFQHRRQIAVNGTAGRRKRCIGQIVPEIKPGQNDRLVIGRKSDRPFHHFCNRKRFLGDCRLNSGQTKPEIAVGRHARERVPEIVAGIRGRRNPGIVVAIDALSIELRQNERDAGGDDVRSAIMSVNHGDGARRISGRDVIRDSVAALDPFGNDRDAGRSYRSVQFSAGQHREHRRDDKENNPCR
ncbi:hypothetical protein GGE46_004064 [Rhizobium etli]|uniref:Uncharacterized protein n=1 Tax=Rhizobium etli TaxID=29449 RepID=A0A7W6ZJK8_RHIET|nr:hypothetical protein [Rhizobium etli]MBB4537295.1 hypothetical protein [Rhizobium etli]